MATYFSSITVVLTRYRLVPLPNLEGEPLMRVVDNTQWINHTHPYRDLPYAVNASHQRRPQVHRSRSR
jgi:hypothetical protein